MHKHHRNRHDDVDVTAQAFLLIVGLCFASSGCGGDRLPVAPVEGEVVYRGKPLEFGSVMFQPDVGPPARGVIGSDGIFELSTYSSSDGAVVGTHRVRIACFESQRPGAAPPAPDAEPGPGRSLIPQRYLRLDTSGLQVEVERSNQPFVFELAE